MDQNDGRAGPQGGSANNTLPVKFWFKLTTSFTRPDEAAAWDLAPSRVSRVCTKTCLRTCDACLWDVDHVRAKCDDHVKAVIAARGGQTPLDSDHRTAKHMQKRKQFQYGDSSLWRVP